MRSRCQRVSHVYVNGCLCVSVHHLLISIPPVYYSTTQFHREGWREKEELSTRETWAMKERKWTGNEKKRNEATNRESKEFCTRAWLSVKRGEGGQEEEFGRARGP